MTQDQLILLLEYISNEIQLQAGVYSNTHKPDRLSLRTELKTKLLATTAMSKVVALDTPSPHDSKHKFSPLMIEMLLFAHHSGHRFYKFPALHYPAQRQAYEYFMMNDYFELVDLQPAVALTPKGKALVEKILNTTL